jgi:hypothetical protein
VKRRVSQLAPPSTSDIRARACTPTSASYAAATQIIATGHLNHDQPLTVGEPVAIVGHNGIVREIIPSVGRNPPRLIIQLLPDRPRT